MRIAITSPYSWTYPGGVNRHVEALASELIARRHEVRVMAPWDPPDRLSRALHRAMQPDDGVVLLLDRRAIGALDDAQGLHDPLLSAWR